MGLLPATRFFMRTQKTVESANPQANSGRKPVKEGSLSRQRCNLRNWRWVPRVVLHPCEQPRPVGHGLKTTRGTLQPVEMDAECRN
jgi:hypothetical protein